MYRWASQVVLVVKNPPGNARDVRDMDSVCGSGRTLEEEMAIHSRILAWKIPWTEEPGGLQYKGSQRVRHNRSDLACTHTHTHIYIFMSIYIYVFIYLINNLRSNIISHLNCLIACLCFRRVHRLQVRPSF